jgi:diketogulonate reductase-like aldo/keto reductase
MLPTTLPPLLYGTAWKAAATEQLTRLALETGFCAIDTANQLKHYYEAGVGAALTAAFAAGLDRAALLLQTKFTFAAGQDQRLPYDRAAPIGTQVAQSFALSLEHLGVETIDSYLLHGTSKRHGLGADDWAAWRAMGELAAQGGVRYLGISNVSLVQLEQLCEGCSTAPSFVQNRCYANTGWDREVRAYCASRGIVYQGFSLLTANARELADPVIAGLAQRLGRSPAEIVFQFALSVGIWPLTGTSNAEHMRVDLQCASWQLESAVVEQIERISG